MKDDRPLFENLFQLKLQFSLSAMKERHVEIQTLECEGSADGSHSNRQQRQVKTRTIFQELVKTSDGF